MNATLDWLTKARESWPIGLRARVTPMDLAVIAAATPLPVPVQAAPQEGDGSRAFKNFHRSLCARFGYTHDENDWRRDLVSLEEHIARMAAHPSACELVVDDAMVERVWSALYNSPGRESTVGNISGKDLRAALTSALQHRGDSRGGEGA